MQKDHKMKQQDQIIQALSKKLNMTETELTIKTELAGDYEGRFVQVREAVDSERFRFETQLRDLTDQVDTKEQTLAKAEERVRQMTEERATLLSKQKELHWERDQESKRMTKEVARLSERADQERADHL